MNPFENGQGKIGAHAQKRNRLILKSRRVEFFFPDMSFSLTRFVSLRNGLLTDLKKKKKKGKDKTKTLKKPCKIANSIFHAGFIFFMKPVIAIVHVCIFHQKANTVFKGKRLYRKKM